MLRATIKDLWARKVRLLTTGLAVLLGVAFMSGTLVLTDTIGRTFDDLFATVYEDTDAVVRGEAQFEVEFGEAQRPLLDEDLAAVVAGVDGVEWSQPEIEGYAQIVGADGEAIGDPGMGAPTFGGAWPTEDGANPFVIDEGRPPAEAGEIAIDRRSADVGDLGVGDTTTVLTQSGTTPVTIVGIARFGDADSPGGASFAMFTFDEAQELIGQAGRLNAISVGAVDGVSQEELRDRIAEVLPAGVEVLTGEAITAEVQGEIRQALGFFNTFMLTFAIVALFVGSFIIYNTFSIIVAQRGRELALLRAVGASRRQVLGSVLLEAVVVGLIAAALGVLAGVAVAAGLQALLAGFGLDVPSTGTVLTAGTVLAGLVTGVVVTVAAAVLPARRATKIPPVAAMREVALDTSGRSRTRLAAGIAVTVLGTIALLGGESLAVVGLGAAVVFVGVAVLGPVIARPVARVVGWPLPRIRGVAGNLARENAMRNPKRTASTAAALMIGVGLVGFITIAADSARVSFLDTIDRAFAGDFVIDSGSFGFSGFSPELAREIGELDEVAVASPLRITFAEVDGGSTVLLAVDPETVGEVLDVGLVEGDYTDVGEGDIAVLESRAEDLGVGVGDLVPVRFAETGEVELRVAAIYTDRELAGEFFTSIATAEANTAGQLDALVLVDRADGTSAEDARSAIDEVVADTPTATVQDSTEYQQAQVDQFNQILGLVYVLLALAVVIALLGIANTLALSIFERTRELGLLRAVGMTRRQMRSTVRYESVIIALLGAALGLAIGLVFGWVIVTAMGDEGVAILSIPFSQLAVIAVIAAIAGVLAAILPARRAARLDVLQAISTE